MLGGTEAGVQGRMEQCQKGNKTGVGWWMRQCGSDGGEGEGEGSLDLAGV